MISNSSTIKASCDLAHPRHRVFAHWTDPTTRARWETGEDTGLKQINFDLRTGGIERVEILAGDQVAGHMIQDVNAVIEGELIATSTRYVIAGETTMMMQLALEFSDIPEGCRISTLAQIIDLTGENLTEQHKSGWGWTFARFEADIDKYGLLKKEQD